MMFRLHHPLHPPRNDAGYASLTAIVLCAALSLMCAGALGLVMAEKKQAQRQAFRAQQLEAINTAVLHFSAAIVRAQGDATLTRTDDVEVPGGHMTVALRAEYDGRKWPLAKAGEVDEKVLKAYTAMARNDFTGLSHGPGKNDCLRSLFSNYGGADPNHELPHGTGLIAMSGGHDGQVWRIRAVTGGRLEERQVRFLGDPDHLFAVVSQEDYALGEMPSCTQLTGQP